MEKLNWTLLALEPSNRSSSPACLKEIEEPFLGAVRFGEGVRWACWRPAGYCLKGDVSSAIWATNIWLERESLCFCVPLLKKAESLSSLFWKIDLAKYINLFNKYLASQLTRFCGRSRGPMYWLGQKVHWGLSIHFSRKALTIFLAGPIKEPGSALREVSMVDSGGWGTYDW